MMTFWQILHVLFIDRGTNISTDSWNAFCCSVWRAKLVNPKGMTKVRVNIYPQARRWKRHMLNRRLTCLASSCTHVTRPVLTTESRIPSHVWKHDVWNKFGNRRNLFHLRKKSTIRASCSHPGLKWRAWSDPTFICSQGLIDWEIFRLLFFLHFCTYCSASPCRESAIIISNERVKQNWQRR